MVAKEQLVEFIVNCVITFLTAFKKSFPEIYGVLEEHYLRAAWSGTKLYTVAQQFLQKQGVDKLFLAEKPQKRVRFIRDGAEVSEKNDCDMVLYDVLQEDGKRYTTKRFASFDEVVGFEMGERAPEVAEKVNMLGLMLQQKDTGKKFDLSLSDNWFVEGNILFDAPMVRYIMREQHKVTMLESDDYEVTFIDEHMNVRTVKATEHLYIEGGECQVISNAN